MAIAAADVAAMPLPGEAGVIDVTRPPYSVDSTGKSDATPGLRRAFQDAARRTPGVFTTGRRAAQIVFLPKGVYRVREPLVFATDEILTERPKGSIVERKYIQGHMMLVGEGRDATRIVLEDNAPLFQSSPRAVVQFTEKGFTNQDYFNWAIDLTIDTGSGNPGAVGLNFVSNNIGGVRDVRLVCRDREQPSAIGLHLPIRGGGLGYIHRVRVDGFRDGVRIGGDYPGYVLEDIELNGQLDAGLRNENKCIGLRKVRSNNTVPAIVCEQEGCVTTLLDSTLVGGARSEAAMINAGALCVRNVTVGGYGAAIRDRGRRIEGSHVTEYVAPHVVSLADSPPTKTHSLEFRPTPDLPWPDPDEWAVFDPELQGDDTDALQSLIDSGAEQIFVKGENERVHLTGTVHLRGKLRRLHGGWSNLRVENGGERGDPLFHFHTGDHDFVILEAFSNGQRRNSFTTFFHDSAKAVVLRDLMMGYGVANYRNLGKGDLYIENVVTGGGDYPEVGEQPTPGWLVQGQRVWARNWNPEDYLPDLRVQGGEVCVLGGKLGEVHGTHLEIIGGAKVEMFGIMLNTNLHRPMWRSQRMSGVSVVIEDAEVTLNAFHDGRHDGPDPVLVSETHLGDAEQLTHRDAPRRRPSSAKDESVVLPLYRSKGAPEPGEESRN